MKKVFGNWKMNPESRKKALSLFNSIKKGVGKKTKPKVAIFPPSIYLTSFKRTSRVELGAQDIYWEEKGAYTGEISPKMVKDIGVKYVLVGHSERRKIFNESNLEVRKKLISSIKNGLNPILCVGESKKEKEEKNTFKIIEKELKESLSGITRNQIKEVTIAYEPIWAIGSGNPCSHEVAVTVILFIRKIISKMFNKKAANEISVIYGGSTNPENAESFLREDEIDGLLVGGSSLDSRKFLKIIETASKY